MIKCSRNRRSVCFGEGFALDFLKRQKSWALALLPSAAFRWIAVLICATNLAGIVR